MNFSTKAQEQKFINSINNINQETAQNHELFISRVNFGFWVAILKHYKNRNKLYNYLSNKTPQSTISKVFLIHGFRNRCFHHECIIKSLKITNLNYRNTLAIIASLTSKYYKNLCIKNIQKITCTNFNELYQELSDIIKSD